MVWVKHLVNVAVASMMTILAGFSYLWIATGYIPVHDHPHSLRHPQEVVLQWAKTFPHDPLTAVTLTTQAFRDGRDSLDWSTDVQYVWDELQFRYRKGQVLSGWTEGNTAMVLFGSTSSSVWGNHERREEYRLIKTADGHWLINDLRLVQDQSL